MLQVRLTTDFVDMCGDDPGFFVPAGTILNVVSDEGDYIIVATQDGAHEFPLCDEYDLLDDDARDGRYTFDEHGVVDNVEPIISQPTFKAYPAVKMMTEHGPVVGQLCAEFVGGRWEYWWTFEDDVLDELIFGL